MSVDRNVLTLTLWTRTSVTLLKEMSVKEFRDVGTGGRFVGVQNVKVLLKAVR